MTYRRYAIEALTAVILGFILTFAFVILPISFVWECIKNPDTPVGVVWNDGWVEFKRDLKDLFGTRS